MKVVMRTDNKESLNIRMICYPRGFDCFVIALKLNIESKCSVNHYWSLIILQSHFAL